MDFKNYLEQQQLTEALKPRHENMADRMKGNGHPYYRDKFLEQHPEAKKAFENSAYTEGRQYRARFPVTLTETSGSPHEDVMEFLAHHGYKTTPENYLKGITNKTIKVGGEKYGIPEQEKVVQHRIGGVLEKHSAPESIKNAFTTDKFRTGAKTNDFDIVVSGHHHDVFGMSTGRGWTSCADAEKTGSAPAFEKMEGEINNHTHVAYLLPRGGNVDTQAMARIAYKHHKGIVSGHETLIPENKVYGSSPPAFQTKANEIMGHLFPKKEGEVYMKNTSVYDDGSGPFHGTANIKPEHIDKIWKGLGRSDRDQMVKRRLVEHIDPSHKYQSTYLNKVSKHIKKLQDASKVSFVATAHANSDLIHVIDPDHAYNISENKHVRTAIEEGAKKFNLHSNDDLAAYELGRLSSINHTSDDLRRGVRSNMKSPKTVEDWVRHSHIKNSGYKLFHTDHIPVNDDHEMGRYGFDTVVHHLANTGQLNHDHFHNAYMSFTKEGLKRGKRKGNLYDHAVEMEASGIPGMSKVVEGVAHRLVERSKESGFFGRHTFKEPNHDKLAQALYHTKPQNRERLAEAMNVGMTAKEIMTVGKNGIAKIREQRNYLKKLLEQATRENANAQ